MDLSLAESPGSAAEHQNVDLYGDFDSIVDFDPEIPHGALDLGMAQEKSSWQDRGLSQISTSSSGLATALLVALPGPSG